jgi:hypothetical protein
MNDADMNELIKYAKLDVQTYGLNMAQSRFGGPRGIWLECSTCNASHVIVGSKSGDSLWAQVPDDRLAEVFINHGWTGEGNNLIDAKCPKCSEARIKTIDMEAQQFFNTMRSANSFRKIRNWALIKNAITEKELERSIHSLIWPPSPMPKRTGTQMIHSINKFDEKYIVIYTSDGLKDDEVYSKYAILDSDLKNLQTTCIVYEKPAEAMLAAIISVLGGSTNIADSTLLMIDGFKLNKEKSNVRI